MTSTISKLAAAVVITAIVALSCVAPSFAGPNSVDNPPGSAFQTWGNSDSQGR